MNVLITRPLVRKTLTGSFLAAFPEFASLQPLLSNNRTPVKVPCPGCGNARKTEERLVGGFVNIIRSLTPDRLQGLKGRLNASKFQCNSYNHTRRAYEVTIL